MEQKQWLENLKVGDDVIITSFGMATDRLAKVLRVTNTQIIVGNSASERKYRKRDGSQIDGDRWHSTHLQEATPEQTKKVREENRHATLMNRLRAVVENSRQKPISLATLEAIDKLLNPPMIPENLYPPDDLGDQ